MSGPVQERGRRRREALLDAAAELLESGGFAAVSHRAVAERARLPLAATTYYFRSRDDLVTQAFERLVQRDLVRLRDLLAARLPPGAATVDELAATLVDAWLPADEAARRHQLALNELYVQAGRRPSLRGLARAWTDGCVEVTGRLLRAAGHPLAESDVRLLVRLADGLALDLLVEERRDARAEAVRLLSRALAALCSAV